MDVPRRRKPTGNAVERIEKALGGEHEVLYKLRVPQRTWARWRAKGRVPLSLPLLRLVALAGGTAVSQIALARELAGLED